LGGFRGEFVLCDDGAVTADLISRSRAGDDQAFAELVAPYRHELLVHCYRMLGSVQDAEDALQEALLAAWRGLGGFEERASIRTWLYRVATRCSLLALRTARRRPKTDWPPPGLDLPEPTRLGEVVWLEPYPDDFLAGLADPAPGPEACYEARETISLAFIAALQLLSPRQRAALVLRDVLDFRASEVAQILESTQESVTSALKRARAALQRHIPVTAERGQRQPLPGSAAERELLARFTRAYESGDVDDLVALLTDDVLLTMPPVPLEYQGRELARTFLAAVAFRPGRSWRVLATRANGQPAIAVYLLDPQSSIAYARGLLVLALSGDRVSAITHFRSDVLSRFGLPATLPAAPHDK
jgi:RNA polymerase sigma-70 factor (ECF subfamily)